MFFSSNKKNKEKETQSQNQTENYKSLSDNLYKQNIDIASKNKSLSILRKLYDISIQTLDPAQLAKEIATTIQTEMGFEFVAVYEIKRDEKKFTPLASSSSTRLQNVEVNFPAQLAILPLSFIDNSFVKESLRQKTSSNTDNLQDFWGTQIQEEHYEKMREDGHMKTVVISPLLLGDVVTGIAVYGLNRSYGQLSDHEIESLNNFSNIIAVAIDRSVLYEKLTHTNKELEAANERQHSLMRFINHQVKGFFTRSRIIFDSLKNDYKKELPEEVNKLVDVGFDTTTQAVEMVRALLDASNLKEGTMNYQKVRLNFRALVSDILDPLKAMAQEKGLELKMNITGADVMINADLTQITQVVRNLVENAINYTKQGSVEVILQENPAEKTVTFEVVDTGIGLTEEDMQKLFTEGGRGQRAKEQNVNSTGYGLFIAKQIVEQHDGKITAASLGEDKGSRFTVKLPMA